MSHHPVWAQHRNDTDAELALLREADFKLWLVCYRGNLGRSFVTKGAKRDQTRQKELSVRAIRARIKST
jgi:hypothetical protein